MRYFKQIKSIFVKNKTIFELTRVAISIFVILLIAFMLNPLVPNNMDEFSLFHNIECRYYPNNKMNKFDVSCMYYDLQFPFTNMYLPLREFGYMGSILSLYLFPFFIVYPHQIITRVVGLLFLIPQAFIYGKILKKDWFPIFFGLVLFFQYFFQHFVDTGAIAIQITFLLLAIYLLNKWLSKQKIKYLYYFSVICFLGIFSKLTFIWYLPSLFIYFIFKVYGNKKKLDLKNILGPLFLFVFLILVLFLSKDRWGNYYYNEFFIDNPNGSVFDFNLSRLLYLVLNPYFATSMIFNVYDNVIIKIVNFIFLFGAIPLSWFYIYKKSNKYCLNSVLWFVLFLFSYFTISLISKAGIIHHVILIFPFLILSFISTFYLLKKYISKKVTYLFILFFLIYNLFFFFTFSGGRPLFGNEYVRYDINKILSKPEIADNYIFVVVDWGMYYYQSLFGNKNQTVLYIQNFSTDGQVDLIRDLAKENNKNLLFIYHRDKTETDPRFIKKNFFVSECETFIDSNSWGIIFEEGSLSKHCIKQ